MKLIRVRCTNCGAYFEKVEENQTVFHCIYCRATFVVEQGRKFSELEAEKTEKIGKYREGIIKTLNPFNGSQASFYAQQILTLIPDDFRARVVLALCDFKQGRPRLLRDLLEKHAECTEEEFLEMFPSIISMSEYRELMLLESAIDMHVSDSDTVYNLKMQIKDRKEFIRQSNELYADVPRDVFVCHSSLQADIGMRVVEELEADGNTCWISGRNLIPDAPYYWKEIERAISRCQIFLVICSIEAMLSKDVQEEMLLAEKYKNKRLEIKLSPEGHTTQFRYFFDGITWIDATSGIDSALSELKRRVYLLRSEEKSESKPEQEPKPKPRQEPKPKPELESKPGSEIICTPPSKKSPLLRFIALFGILGCLVYFLFYNNLIPKPESTLVSPLEAITTTEQSSTAKKASAEELISKAEPTPTEMQTSSVESSSTTEQSSTVNTTPVTNIETIVASDKEDKLKDEEKAESYVKAMCEQILIYDEYLKLLTQKNGDDDIKLFDDIQELFRKYLLVINTYSEVGRSLFYGFYNNEAIEWIILDKKGDYLLLLSKYALDLLPYNESLTGATWEDCSLRKWLNGTFLESAFKGHFRENIVTTKVQGEINPKYKTIPGNDITVNDTEDKIFLLSLSEVQKYLNSDSLRQSKLIDYNSEQQNGQAVWWWLRSLGKNSLFAAGVSSEGFLAYYGINVNRSAGIRPAMWVSLQDRDNLDLDSLLKQVVQ